MKATSDMTDPHDKVEVVQRWINELRQKQATDPAALNATSAVLNEIVEIIHDGGPHPSSEQGLSETYADLELQIQEQTAALNRATSALKSQITERETAARKLRQAYNDLETHLQEHLAYQSKLN